MIHFCPDEAAAIVAAVPNLAHAVRVCVHGIKHAWACCVRKCTAQEPHGHA